MTKKKPKVSPATPINREAAAAARASFRENFPEADAELFPRTSPSGDHPNARAREVPWHDALGRWVQLIAEGGLERAAAAKVCAEMGYPEITRDALRGRAVSDPVWKEALAMAHDTKIDTLERVVHTIATQPNVEEEPAAVGNRLKAALAMLPKLDWERWGDRQRIENTGKDGGAVKQEIVFTVAELREIAKGTTE